MPIGLSHTEVMGDTANWGKGRASTGVGGTGEAHQGEDTGSMQRAGDPPQARGKAPGDRMTFGKSHTDSCHPPFLLVPRTQMPHLSQLPLSRHPLGGWKEEGKFCTPQAQLLASDWLSLLGALSSPPDECKSCPGGFSCIVPGGLLSQRG